MESLNIKFELTELLEKVSVHDEVYECIGYDQNNNKYTGIAEVSCGEIVNVTEINKI